jgi:hypothetical protein
MKTTHMLLVAGAVTAIVLSAPIANAIVFRPLVVINPTGAVRIQQGLPCGGQLDTMRPIIGGRIDVTPSTIPSDTRVPLIFFNLTRMDLFLEPFSVRQQCRGIEATAEFYEIGLRLARAVVVPGEQDGPPELRRFRFTIPKDQFLVSLSIRDNAPTPQPERRYKKPSEDVTGVIDLLAQTVEIHVTLASRMHFRAGCVGEHCTIDEFQDGSQGADVRGEIVPPDRDSDHDGIPDLVDNCPRTRNPSQAPDAIPPSVSCTAVGRPGGSFQVSAADDCSSLVTIRLGPFTIRNGEVIQIEQTGQPGVRLLNDRGNGIRHFQVGNGEALVSATDASGNTANAACR